jgi:hypothetical protein
MQLCLVTHHKAGTHWCKYFLANYVALLLTAGRASRVDFDEMEKNYFPIRIDSYFDAHKSVPSHPLSGSLRLGLGLDAMYWAHIDPGKKSRFLDFGKVIFQCRNPMDFLVSKYHYDLKRLNVKAINLNLPAVLTPWDMHPDATASWCQIFSAMVDLTNSDTNKFEIISYEQLKLYPESFFGRMIEHLFGVVNSEYLVEAIARSSIENARQDEIKRDKPIVGPTYSTHGNGFAAGSFVRSGAVGQFNKYFDSAQQAAIQDTVLSSLDDAAVKVFNKLFHFV